MTTTRLDPLTEPRPSLDPDTAHRLLAAAWGVRGDLTPLHGERDLNFRVVDSAGPAYVLKVHNPADTEGVVDFQTAAVAHIARVAPELPVGGVVPTAGGDAWTTLTDTDGRRCHARLLTHLPGRHPGRDELDERGLFEWGRMAALLGRALRGFFHPEAGYPIAWDIRRLPAVRPWADALDGDERDAVLAVVDRHEREVAPALAAVRGQVVHNDLSRDNVLVEAGAISGVTDFGDMTHTALVCDLAVAVADVLDGRPDSLHLAESMIAGYVSVTPLEPAEADLLADLVAGRCAAALAIQAWRRREDPSAPKPSGGAWRLLQQLQAEGLDRVRVRFANAAAGVAASGRGTGELQAARSRTLGPLPLSYRHPVHLVRGRGVELYDADGRRYLDAYNNVPVLGHSHPAVTAAVSRQLRLLNTNTRYLQDAPIDLAERLLATIPAGRLDRVLFVNSGSEANDLAWRIACHATGHSGGIVTRFAYHGVTTATTALSPESWLDGRPRPGIELVDPPNLGVDEPREVQDAVARLDADGFGTAAMVVDGVFTSDGVLGPAHEWTRDALAAVHGSGGLYVADEVQAGFGRTGEHLWSFVPGGLEPDFVTLGKPMGNGYPVAAVLSRAELVDPFMEETDYFSTFGGGTAACAAALAVLDTVEAEGLVDHARAVGAHLAGLLGELAGSHAAIGAVRAWGLAVGVDVRDPASGEPAPALARRLVEGLRDRGVLIGLTGAARATLKIRPPLVFTVAHADRLAADLAAALDDADPAAGAGQ